MDTFTAKLPNLIYESDTVFEAVRTVARSIGFGLEDMVSPYLSLDSLLGLAADALKNLDINGQTVSLVLPEIDWNHFSSLGSLAVVPTAGADYAQKYAVKGDQPAVFVELLRYVERTLSQNRAEVERLLGTIDGIGDFLPVIQEVLNALSEKDALTSLVIGLLAPQETEPSKPGSGNDSGSDQEDTYPFPDGGDDSQGGETADDIENPGTGDTAVSVAALLAIAAGAGAILVIIRKKAAITIRLIKKESFALSDEQPVGRRIFSVWGLILRCPNFAAPVLSFFCFDPTLPYFRAIADSRSFSIAHNGRFDELLVCEHFFLLRVIFGQIAQQKSVLVL